MKNMGCTSKYKIFTILWQYFQYDSFPIRLWEKKSKSSRQVLAHQNHVTYQYSILDILSHLPANPIILLTRYFRLYLVTCQFPEAATNEDEIEDALLKYRNINVATRKQLLYSKWTILTYIPPSSISGITNFVMAIQMSQFKENIVGNSFTWHKNLWYVTNTI